MRYAVGYDEFVKGDFDLRTLYYFRQRLSRYMQEKGVNLLDQAFEQVTDQQIEAFQLKTGLQRMDNTMVGSNIRQMGWLQLLVEALQRVQRMLNKSDQASYNVRRIQRYLEAQDRLGKLPQGALKGPEFSPE